MTDPHNYDLSLFVPPGLAVEVRGMDVGRPVLAVAAARDAAPGAGWRPTAPAAWRAFRDRRAKGGG